MIAKKLTAREVAKKLHVTEGAVSLATKRGRIVKDPDGLIDPSHPVNATYLRGGPRQRHQSGGKTAAIPKQKRHRSSMIPDSGGDSGAGEPSGGDARSEKLEEEVKKIRADRKGKELNNAIKRGTLIERVLVHRFLSRLYVVDTSELRPMGDRISSTLVGMVRSTDSDEIATTRVNDKITEEIFHSLEHIQVRLNQFIADGMPEEVDDVQK